MSTLLLRLAAPIQSWGSSDKFSRRSTNREPARSGVVGMIACAMGRSRQESIDDLAAVRFGVRLDQAGGQLRDFHMTHKEWGTATAFLSERYYLTDAIFLVGLEAEDTFLERIDEALRTPVFPLFLGRRACPPAGQMCLGIRAGASLSDALRNEPWIASNWYRKEQPDPAFIEIVLDGEPGEEGSLVRDLPISFDQTHRKYGLRIVKREWIRLKNEFHEGHHDPFNVNLIET